MDRRCRHFGRRWRQRRRRDHRHVLQARRLLRRAASRSCLNQERGEVLPPGGAVLRARRWRRGPPGLDRLDPARGHEHRGDGRGEAAAERVMRRRIGLGRTALRESAYDVVPAGIRGEVVRPAVEVDVDRGRRGGAPGFDLARAGLLRGRRRPRGADVVLGNVHGRVVTVGSARRPHLPVQLGGPSFLDIRLLAQIGRLAAMQSGPSTGAFPAVASRGAHSATSSRAVASATASRGLSPSWSGPRTWAATWGSGGVPVCCPAGGSGGAFTVAGARGPRPATRCRRFRMPRRRYRAIRGAAERWVRARGG
jgi:hypothetical protein